MNNIRISDGPIYIDLPYPYLRRKVNVTFKYNEKFIKQSIIIQDHWDTVENIIDHLKQTSIISKLLVDITKDKLDLSLYLYSTDDKLITLDSIVNGQKLNLKLEPTKQLVEYSVNSESSISLSSDSHSNNSDVHSPSDSNSGIFKLWSNEHVSESLFLNQCFDLQSRYPDRIQIGEVYPYRFRFYISKPLEVDGKDLGVWLYIVDQPSIVTLADKSHKINYTFTVYSNNSSLSEIVKQCISEYSVSTNAAQFEDLIELAIQKFNLFYRDFYCVFEYQPTLHSHYLDWFPSTYKVAPTLTKSNFYHQCYQDELNLSSKSGLPVSICKGELLNSKDCKFKSSFSALKKKYYPDNFRKGNTVNQKNDLRCYRFKLDGFIECPVCLDDESGIEASVQLTCGHSLCAPCFQQYISSNRSSGKGNSAPIGCPIAGCLNILDSVTISTFLDEQQWSVWNEQLFNDYYLNSNSRKCLFKGCGRVVYKYPNYDKVIPYVPCSCYNVLCLFCGSPGVHWPSSCSDSISCEGNLDELESLKYIIKFTTLCPNCQNPVERTEGCNQLFCRCGFTFCYGCGKNYYASHVCSQEHKQRSIAVVASHGHKLGVSPDELLKIIELYNINVTDIIDLKEGSEKALVLLGKMSRLFFKLKTQAKVKPSLIKKIATHMDTLWCATGGRTNKSLYIALDKPDQYSMVKTLVCDIAMNGYNQVIAQVFVNRNMDSFKLDLLTTLNKQLVQKRLINLENADATQKLLRKIRLYTIDGYEIITTNDISLKEKIFVTLEAETFAQPKDEPNPNIIENTEKGNVKCSHSNTHHVALTKENVINEILDLRSNPAYRQQEYEISSEDSSCEDDFEVDDDELIITKEFQSLENSNEDVLSSKFPEYSFDEDEDEYGDEDEDDISESYLKNEEHIDKKYEYYHKYY